MTLTPGAPDWACDGCNYDRHLCHFCGDNITHEEAMKYGTCEGDREYGRAVLREAFGE